eukprot:2541602-Heterocapsa_arctica.AAC.1
MAYVDDDTHIVFSENIDAQLAEDQVPKRSLDDASQEGPLAPAQPPRIRTWLTPTIGCSACGDAPRSTHTLACNKRKHNFELRQRKAKEARWQDE